MREVKLLHQSGCVLCNGTVKSCFTDWLLFVITIPREVNNLLFLFSTTVLKQLFHSKISTRCQRKNSLWMYRHRLKQSPNTTILYKLWSFKNQVLICIYLSIINFSPYLYYCSNQQCYNCTFKLLSIVCWFL